MNNSKIAIVLSAAALTACSPQTSDQETTPGPEATTEAASDEADKPYSRYTIAKQDRILAKQEAGETLTEDELDFLEKNPPIEEEEED